MDIWSRSFTVPVMWQLSHEVCGMNSEAVVVANTTTCPWQYSRWVFGKDIIKNMLNTMVQYLP